ncbi:MAG: UvrD-helicase domain-containing protein, partial [Nitrospirota bacterium]|nr:UvrD-helicase domain-containing protein [Nitrospirota bacterium]
RVPLISTFHSLCLMILKNEIEHLGYRKNFTVYGASDQISLVRNLMSDITVPDRSFKIDSIMEHISREKNGMPSLSGESDAAFSSVSQSVAGKYQEALKAFNAVDFDDLILLTLRLFREHPDVLVKYHNRFKYIMVDEYQDTNRVQYDFIRLLAGPRRNLCVVGDDDQSIYGWRGASLDNILGFEKDFHGAKVVRLEQNYRSFGNILKAANGVIKNNRHRMVKALWTERGNGPVPRLVTARDADDEARWVADRIALIRYEKKRAWEDFAVIYRANILSRPFEEALRMLRIPYTVVGGTSYFERKEILDIAAYLKLMANPRDDLSLIRIANIPKRGLGPTSMARLAEFAQRQNISLLEAFAKAKDVPDLGDKVAETAGELAAFFERYRGRFDEKSSLPETLKEMIREIGYNSYLYEAYKTPEAAVRKIQNVEGFVDSLMHYEKESLSEGEKPELRGFLESLALTDMDRKKDETFGVTLISLHSSKGLEFPVVFIAGVEEDLIPHKKSAADIEEERRLFYVGITRAKEELYLACTESRTKYGKEQPSTPSRFIEEIPADAIERQDRAKESSPEEGEVRAKAFFANIRTMLAE